MAESCLISTIGLAEFKPRQMKYNANRLCSKSSESIKGCLDFETEPIKSRKNTTLDILKRHRRNDLKEQLDDYGFEIGYISGSEVKPTKQPDTCSPSLFRGFTGMGFESESCSTESRRNGRPSMEHPTKVYGDITRSWTPVFTLLEHKYVEKDRTELGKPKRRGVIIPAGFTYGRPNEQRDGGSSEALHGWPRLSDTTLPFKRKEKTAQRDFMALNRAAVSAGLVSANDQYEFRATHDVRRKTQSEDSHGTRTRRIPPSMVFGISTRPSTPIFDLLEHKYQDKWLQQRRQMELAKRQEENKQKRSTGQVYETRASLLRTYQNPVDPDPLWQMPKFTKEARPNLQTFRSADARRRAYDHFESDKISRKGTLGHGVFESAKN